MDVEHQEEGPRRDRGESPAAALDAALVAALFTQSPFSVGLYDSAGRVVTGNPAYERHWGIDLADVPADYSLFDDPQLETSGMLQHIRRAYAGEHVVLPRVRYDAARAAGVGRAVWTQGHCAPVRNAEGVVTHVAIIHEDVTDRVEAELALAASEARFRELLEQAPDAVFVADRDGRYTDVNRNACLLFGYTREQLLALTVADLVAEADRPRLARLRERLLSSVGAVVAGEWDLRRADGSFFPAGLSTKILPDGSWQAILRDVTERRRAEAERERLYAAAEEARRTAEAANKAKGDFLAVMSHELRTPLNAIGGYAELMELGIHGAVTAEQREALSRIQRSQQHLLGLINDVLNFVKLESGHVRYDMEDVPLRSALKSSRISSGLSCAPRGCATSSRSAPHRAARTSRSRSVPTPRSCDRCSSTSSRTRSSSPTPAARSASPATSRATSRSCTSRTPASASPPSGSSTSSRPSSRWAASSTAPPRAWGSASRSVATSRAAWAAS